MKIRVSKLAQQEIDNAFDWKNGGMQVCI